MKGRYYTFQKVIKSNGNFHWSLLRTSLVLQWDCSNKGIHTVGHLDLILRGGKPRMLARCVFKKEVKVLVTQSRPTLCDPMDCKALQAPLTMEFSRQEYWRGVATPFYRGSSQSRDQTWVSYIAGRLFTVWATRVAWEGKGILKITFRGLKNNLSLF